MIQAIITTISPLLDILGLWWWEAFTYYNERSTKLSIYFLCRENKYTGKKYFRTMRPGCNGMSGDNEWIEYEGLIDDIIL